MTTCHSAYASIPATPVRKTCETSRTDRTGAPAEVADSRSDVHRHSARTATSQGITYLAGGLLFGIALYRARVLSRWGSALLAAGAVFTVSLSVLPESFYRLLAYPNAIAHRTRLLALARRRSPEQHGRIDWRHPHELATGRRVMSATLRPQGSGRWVPLALIALAGLPVIAGTLRLSELAGGPPVLPFNPRIAESPAPVVIHVASAILYLVVGAFHFSPPARRRWLVWHRRAGRVLVVLGFAVALSALWMTQFYAREVGTGILHYLFRLGFGSAMAVCLVLGVAAVRRHDFVEHQAWMIRAYALAAGAGTQVFTLGIGESLFGASELSSGLALGAGWAINLTVAEYVITRIHNARVKGSTALQEA